MGVTLFTTPRPFAGLYETIQRNALKSWSLLDPFPAEIVVFADEEHEGEGAVAYARDLGFLVLPINERSARGVPLISDLFPRAVERGNEISCYTNADIILEGTVISAIEDCANLFDRCLMIARRWNVQVIELMDFQDGWEAKLREKVEKQGSLMAECAIDLFAWKGEVWPRFKPYAIGRYRWDNWLCGMARFHNVPMIDITPAVRITHQSHAQVQWDDPDAQENFRIMGVFCGTKDSTHTYTEEGLVEGWLG